MRDELEALRCEYSHCCQHQLTMCWNLELLQVTSSVRTVDAFRCDGGVTSTMIVQTGRTKIQTCVVRQSQLFIHAAHFR